MKATLFHQWEVIFNIALNLDYATTTILSRQTKVTTKKQFFLRFTDIYIYFRWATKDKFDYNTLLS